MKSKLENYWINVVKRVNPVYDNSRTWFKIATHVAVFTLTALCLMMLIVIVPVWSLSIVIERLMTKLVLWIKSSKLVTKMIYKK